MGRLNRRQFLQQGSLAVAAAGVAGALPGAANLLDDEAPALSPEASAAVDSGLPEVGGQPVVARVTDASTGEIQMFFGTSSTTVNDPELATRLVRAAAR
jgi:hypothetical protein